MKLVQQTGALEPQFREIVENAIDKRVFADVTSGGPDVEFSIEHGLGIIPLGYLVISQDKAGSVYKSDGTIWDTSRIYLKSSVNAVTLRVLIF